MISSSINQNNANASQSITTPANNTEEHVRRARERERAQERATKRFAFVTKEVDYRVARAYVALAEEFSDSSDDGSGEKAKKARGRAGDVDSALTRNAEARAVDRYLEDEEWERNELRAGRPPKPPSFPWVKQRSSASSSSKKGG
ncbi:hypothetical protein DL93DRAFT_2083702 [Clavulina sp. PMI_390]|nr:hypothetical protein DL93DRAFT_2083702 [Clavulina sp. PMI_390]